MDYVKEKLGSHGDAIISRWSKRSRNKRGKLSSDAAGEYFGPWPRVVTPPEDAAACKKQVGSNC
jgi:hypothetical protein